MSAKGCSRMYEEFLLEFPESSIARNVKTFGRVLDQGGFENALYDGRYQNAWDVADLGNKEKMVKLGFSVKK
jgi:hypothetical protein